MAQTAPVTTPWTLTTPAGTDESQTRAAFSADGKRAAFLMGNRLSVYALAPTGALGRLVWNSPAPQKITAFVWAGQKLFFSRQNAGAGETRSLSFAPIGEKPLLPVGAASLKLAPGGQKLALVPLQSPGDKDTRIEFYEWAGATWKRYGRYEGKGTGALERPWKESRFGRSQWLYLLDWNDDGRGVFAHVPAVVGAEDDQPPSPDDLQLCLVLPENAALPLSRPDDVGPYFRPNMLPMGGVWKRDGVRAVPGSWEFFSEFGPLQKPRALGSSVQPPTWLDEYKRGSGQLVAYLPDSRFALQQLESDDGQGKAKWIVSDLEGARWKNLGEGAAVVSAHGWNGSRLLVRTRGKGGALGWGQITVSPGWLASETGWTKIPSNKGERNEAEVAVQKFFTLPHVASFAPLRPFEDDFRRQNSPDEPVSFSFWGREYEPYIRVDRKTNRVVFFDGPDAEAPLPDIPVSSEKVQENALAFLRVLLTPWNDDAAPKLSVIAPIGGLTYRVRADFPESAPASYPRSVLLRVRASDGLIQGYDENLEKWKNNWTGWTQASAPRPASPFQSLRPSPDGRFLLFRWNAPRPGLPAWWQGRPYGLYLLDLKEKSASRFIGETSGPAHWSPDSRHFAFVNNGYKVYDLETGKIQVVPMPSVPQLRQRLLGWKSANELLLGMRVDGDGYDDMSGMDLRVFRLNAPAPPKLWKANWSAPMGDTQGFENAAIAPDGKSLFVAWTRVRAARVAQGDRLGLWKCALNGDATPSLVRTEDRSFPLLQWSARGILWESQGRSSADHNTAFIDPATNKATPWSLPSSVAERINRLHLATSSSFSNDWEFRLSADGQTIFFSGLEAGSALDKAALYASDLEGKSMRAIWTAPPKLAP